MEGILNLAMSTLLNLAKVNDPALAFWTLIDAGAGSMNILDGAKMLKLVRP